MMKIEFADTFVPSFIKVIQGENPWHWRYWNNKRYEINWFFKNLRSFIKLAWVYRPWNFDYGLYPFLEFHLRKTRNSIYNGNEVRESANVKLKDIEKCIRAVRRLEAGNYFDLAERCVPEKERQLIQNYNFTNFNMDTDSETDEVLKEYYSKINKFEERDWNTIWTLIKENGNGWWD